MTTLRSDGIELHYEDRGEGKPIVLLHGFTSSFAGTWEGTGWAALLTASGRRVIGSDFPSHGQSEAAYNPRRCRPEQLAADVVALLDRLDLDRADVVGFSMGAGVALRVAMAYPSRVRCLVVGGIGDAALNPRHDPQQVARIADAFQLESAEDIDDPVAARIRRNAEAVGRDLNALLPYLQGGGWPGSLDELGHVKGPILLFVAESEQYMAKTDRSNGGCGTRRRSPQCPPRRRAEAASNCLSRTTRRCVKTRRSGDLPTRIPRVRSLPLHNCPAGGTSRVFRSFHVRLIVADFDGCFRFYRDVLRLRVTWGEEADGSARGYASFEIPGGSLSINDQAIVAPVVGVETREAGESVKDRALLVFEVESVDAEAERLHASGVAFETEPTTYPGWGIRAAHLRDPDGTLIEINELLAPEQWSEDLREEQARYERS